MLRGEATSPSAGFLEGSSILVELEFGDFGFCGGRKTGEPREKPLEEGSCNCSFLRGAFSKFQLWSFGPEKFEFLKLSQMNGLDK